MTTNSTPHESRMLEEVRRWRKEAYDGDRSRTSEQRAARVAELLHRFGLPSRPGRDQRKPDTDGKAIS